MKLGLGLGDSTLKADNLVFARQLGVTHIIIFMPGESLLPSTRNGIWSYEDLVTLKKFIESYGLKVEGIENFQPANWDQILLKGQKRENQMENIKRTVSNMGRAGIPVMGYNFSLAGVYGRVEGPYARGGAISPGYTRETAPEDTPIPNGFVWNTKISENAPPGNIGTVSEEEMWDRIKYFLKNIIPVAEEAGVRMAAHPEDPPLAVMRQTARLLVNTENYDRLFDIVKSDHNAIEFCQGTFSEMPDVNVYDAIRKFASSGKIGYVHFRNVRGKLPDYHEVFIDEGDIDMAKALQVYKECGYNGVMIPDHTPDLLCPAPWHTGVAYAISHLRALMKNLGIEIEE